MLEATEMQPDIAVDARWIFRGPTSGVRTMGALTRAMSRRPDAARFLFLVDERDVWDAQRMLAAGGSSVDALRYPTGLLSSHTTLQRALKRHPSIDVCLYQYFAPVVSEVASAVLVHDAILFDHPEWFTRAERLYLTPKRILSRRSDMVITVSSTEQARLSKLGFGARSRVIDWGVDESFSPLEDLDDVETKEILTGLDLSRPYVLYVGRLNARKNLAVLPPAIGRVNWAREKQGLEPVELVVVGPRDGLPSEIAEDGNVRLLGRISDAELEAVMASARAFVFPSLDEGCGLPPLEAMRAGVPAIVADIDVMRENCGEAALYCDPHGVDDWATAIDRLVGEPALGERLASLGRIQVADRTWERAADQMVSALEAAAQGRSATTRSASEGLVVR